MSDELFDEGAYRRFASDLEDAVKSPGVQKVKLEDLRRPALESARKTKFGSHGWRSFTSSRIGPKTVYLGSESVRLPSPSELHKQIIGNAPAELEKVIHLLKTMPFIHLQRTMGDNPDYNPRCNLYMSVACKKNYRNGFMWGNTMRAPDKKPGPDFHLIHIPEEHFVRQQVLAIPEHNINVVMGSDYMGEDKKGFLRQAMWYADQHDMLGLHAGTKLVRARDTRTGKLKNYGVFLFGLSATGKSTWSCHHLGLDPKQDEETLVCQDDIVFLRRDGSAYGSESGFFVKTDVEEHLQEAMYNALVDKTALYENVMIDHEGNPDFLDESLCGNGRAVVQKSKLRRKIGWRMSRMDSPTINLPPLDELDGLMFAFITRRNTIMPFSLELTPEQAVLAYLWGESSHSFASQPAKAGESTRVVGTDPFIIGSRAHKVNRFRDIIYDLVGRYPGKVRFFQYNTGGVGEIIETSMVDGKKKKNMIRKVARVPIDTMAAIQRGDVRMTNQYKEGRLGTKEVVAVEGCDLSAYDPAKLYTKDQIDFYLKDLVEGRRKFTEVIAAEGLDADIIKAAEESYSISRSDRTQVSVPSGEKVEEERPARTVRAPVRDYFADYAPIRRPRRPSSRRSR